MSASRPILTGTADPGDAPFDVLAWVTSNWWVIAFVALWCVIGYGWYRLRGWAASTRGKAIRPLHQLLYLVVRFVLWDDRGPILTRPASLAKYTKPLRWNITYLAGAGATIAFWSSGRISTAVYLLIGLLILVLARATRTFRHRWATLQQMFAVAAADLRYPKGANTAPWSYIRITRWDNLTRPGPVVITVPPGVPSENPKTRDRFEENWKGTVTNAHGWQFEWESHNNRILATPQPLLPERVSYPLPDPHPWHEFPLGDAGGGRVATWDVTTAPHILIAGPTGTGKSVLQRNVLLHALASPTWRVLGIDPKKVELGWLRGLPGVLKVTTDLFDSVDLVDDVEKEMHRRYEQMEQLGVNHFLDMPEPPPALLLMVDEVFAFLSPEGIKSDEGKERDEAHARASILIGSIARLGRAAGVHLALATQRPDATVIKGEMKNNLDARVAAGRMDTTPSLMVLDSEEANRLPGIKGRGFFRMGNQLTEFQGYFLTQSEVQDEIRRAAAANAAREVEIGDDDQESPGRHRKGLWGRFLAARAASVQGLPAQEADPSKAGEAEVEVDTEGTGGGRSGGKLLKRLRAARKDETGEGEVVDPVEVDPVEASVEPDGDGTPAVPSDVPVPDPVGQVEASGDPEQPVTNPGGGLTRPTTLVRPAAAPEGTAAAEGPAPVPAGGGLARPTRNQGSNSGLPAGQPAEVPTVPGVEDPFSQVPSPRPAAVDSSNPNKAGGGWPAPPKRDDLPDPDADAVVDPFASWPPAG